MVMKPTKKPDAKPKDDAADETLIAAETAEGDGADIVTEPDPEQPTLDEALAKLKAAETARDAATARAESAEKTARDASTEVAAAHTEKASAELIAVNNGIATTKANQAALKTALREARAAGDVDAEFDILDKVASAAHDLKALEYGKANMEAAAKQPRAAADPVEATARAMEQGASPKSATWIRSHPQYITNPRLNSKMIAAHHDALAEGHAADSPEYISSIEISLGLGKRDDAPAVNKKGDDGDVEAAAAPTGGRRATPPPAAPPSRGGSESGRVTLTAAEREIAEMNFPDMKPNEAYRAYAENKLALQKEGKLGATQH